MRDTENQKTMKTKNEVPRAAHRFLFPDKPVKRDSQSDVKKQGSGRTMMEMLEQVGKASPSSTPLRERMIEKGKTLSKRLERV